MWIVTERLAKAAGRVAEMAGAGEPIGSVGLPLVERGLDWAEWGLTHTSPHMPRFLALAFALASFLTIAPTAQPVPDPFDPAPAAPAETSVKECIYVGGIPIVCI